MTFKGMLKMMAEFRDMQEMSHGLNGTRVYRLAELLMTLDRLRDREPFMFDLAGENGKRLSVGISPTCGCAQFSSSDGDPPYWVAVAPGEHDIETEGMEFLMGGTPTPILERHCVPTEMLMHIIDHFLATGDRPPDVLWEEV
jgi:hypothetical protein